ncbi:MAG: S8 family serine peptidase [Leptolyngbya sp. UWPOB_LEPTO1]|uniref:S8 family serine peptidase n=1 Tax=Leptolyngbya sp. UWPOB_LEPTO1 TaxID=2815653 RepID=UPI001AC6ACA4|nr:S8 family serine peptidase [Leptolyngbya sp. UWPOB_LEPTO1]MBN8564840.1 S8 family serine peptidase [Leptolyngbya sp. UWPOB_LEPTO1]
MLATKTTQSDWLSLDRHQPIGSRALFDHSPHSFNLDRQFSAARLTQSDALLANEKLTTFSVNTQQIVGTFRADTFTVSSAIARTIISGNGNTDFGSGRRDLLDLSSTSSSSVRFNWANQAGVAYNPGTGTRIFDAIDFNDGRQILFEGIESIQFADRVVNLAIVPNDPLFSQQWNLHMIGVQNAWRFTTGSPNVLIGVEDTGLSLDRSNAPHLDLGSTRALAGQFADDGRENHGTAVQGIIAAATDNGIGMSGINWKSTVIHVDILGRNWGDLSLAEGSQQIINQARQTGHRLVINLSLGIPKSFGVNYSTGLEEIVKNNPDVVFVIAAGNDGHLRIEGIASPANLARLYNNVIAVGAVWGTQNRFGQTTTPGTRIEYPSWWGSQYGEGLTLMAPSEVIAPTSRDTFGDSVRFTYQSDFNGTSAATPQVTGIASLLLSVNPVLSAAQVRQILVQTATDVAQPGFDKFTGAGVVNADAAVRRAIALWRGFA